MGFTVYYRSSEKTPSKDEIEAINSILESAYHIGTITADPMGIKNVRPKVKEGSIVFNGVYPNEYETFVFNFGRPDSLNWFCKTGKREYTSIVCVLLAYLKQTKLCTDWSTD